MYEHLKWQLFLHLTWSFPPSKWRDHPLHFSISFLHLISFPSCHHGIYHSFLCSCLCLYHLIIFIHHLLPVLFNSRLIHHNYHILVFFLLSSRSEPSHLTTWLSSCPVRIFFGSHLALLKIKNHKQEQPIKMCNLKNQLISCGIQRMVIFCLFALSWFRPFKF